MKESKSIQSMDMEEKMGWLRSSKKERAERLFSFLSLGVEVLKAN